MPEYIKKDSKEKYEKGKIEMLKQEIFFLPLSWTTYRLLVGGRLPGHVHVLLL